MLTFADPKDCEELWISLKRKLNSGVLFHAVSDGKFMGLGKATFSDQEAENVVSAMRGCEISGLSRSRSGLISPHFAAGILSGVGTIKELLLNLYLESEPDSGEVLRNDLNLIITYMFWKRPDLVVVQIPKEIGVWEHPAFEIIETETCISVTEKKKA